MQQSKFLLNRQKIFNPLEIHAAIASHFRHLPEGKSRSFFYRLEWYKIGVVVPMLVYSEHAPEMKLMPECQLLETTRLEDLPTDRDEIDFAIFAVPGPELDLEGEIDEIALTGWLQKQLKGAASLSQTSFGPNNCIYYQQDTEELHVQTVTIKGSLKVKDRSRLEKLRRQPLGACVELGCGLLHLATP
jgi:hypothetical protein